MVKALKRPTRKNGKKPCKKGKGKYASRKKVGGDIPSNSPNNSNNNNKVVIGTYNMSFYGDKGFDFNYDHYKQGISEFAFQRMVNQNYPRRFWMNANDQLIDFIKEKEPAMVGLQEMNDTINYIELLKDWDNRNQQDSSANRILNKFNDNFNTYGTDVYEKIVNEKRNSNNKIERNSIEIKEYIFYNVLHSFYNIRSLLENIFKEEKETREVSYIDENNGEEKKKTIPVGYTINLDIKNTRNDIIKLLNQHGTQKIKDDLQLINRENNKNYKIAHDFVEVNEAGSAIIYDENVLGKIVGAPTIEDLGKGRPVLFALTQKQKEKENEYNLLINAHGDQQGFLMNPKNGKLSDRIKKFDEFQETNNKKKIEEKANKFIEGKPIKQIFITGDFNDRYNAIKNFSISGKLVEQKKPVRACCYNYDSTGVMGTADIENPDDVKKANEDSTLKGYIDNEKREKYYFNERPSSKKPIENGGKIGEYLNFGDKVFGLKPISDMEIYNTNVNYKTGISNRSDHEFVFGEFSLNVSTSTNNNPNIGGKRRNKRKTSKKPKKSRKSKKQSTYRKRR